MCKKIQLPHPEITPQAQVEIEAMGLHVYQSTHGLRVAGEVDSGPIDLGARLFCALAESSVRPRGATP